MRWRDSLHITYCTNVHPGEGLTELKRVLSQEVKATRAELSSELLKTGAPLGTGLRIGAEAAAALGDAQAREELLESLAAVQGYVFTLNGFPYGDFAAPVVKERVYEPSWCDEERLSYTLALAELLSALPGPAQRSISTVAGRFEPRGYLRCPHQLRAQLGAQLGELSRGLAELEARTGVLVRVALEPEPATTLETVEDAIDLFERYIWPAEPLSQRYLGLCYDTCHQAVMFEDPRESWARLREAGLPVVKVQISNALSIPRPRDPEARLALASFAEPRYLHQVTALRGGETSRLIDLPELLDERGELREAHESWLEAEAWRCHFHVPLWWRGAPERGLETTHEHWRAIAKELAREAAALPSDASSVSLPHVEVETYSWGVIPKAHREDLGSLHSCVARELETLYEELNSVGLTLWA